jgi:hypothetical protein
MARRGTAVLAAGGAGFILSVVSKTTTGSSARTDQGVEKDTMRARSAYVISDGSGAIL